METKMQEKNKRPVYPELGAVRLKDAFYAPFTEKIGTVAVHDILTKFRKDGAEENYRRVAAGKKGGHGGPPWYHGLICECIRGISDLLLTRYDEGLDRQMDEIIDVMGQAIDAVGDGYLNPYTTLECPEARFGRNGGNTLYQHETYNPGCLAEAAVHHYKATGKKTLLRIAVKNWNYMASVIGAPPKKNVSAEHSIAEEALVKLAQLFYEDPALSAEMGAQPDEYLRVANFLLDSKGHNEDRYAFPYYMEEYAQDHRPVREQRDAVGHAVRAALLYTGMATVAEACEDESLAVAAKGIYENIVTSKLHANGCVGAHRANERFGRQYELPNNAYLETCAGIAFAFFSYRLFRLYPEARIYDEIECTLRNLVPTSISDTFDHYTYENPLRADGTFTRWEWHKCPCCPPMLLKIVGMLPQFVYALGQDTVWVNLYVDSMMNTGDYGLSQKGKRFSVCPKEGSKELTLRLRIPNYARGFAVTVNGRTVPYTEEKGYAVLLGAFCKDDVIEVTFAEPIVKYEAHPFVKEDRGQIMVKKGPVLYCIEAIDNPWYALDKKGNMVMALDPDAPLTPGEGDVILGKDTEGHTVTMIPYYRWDNRGATAMRVWLPEAGKTWDVFAEDEWRGVLYRAYKEY